MIWQINQWQFNPAQQLLQQQDHCVRLEPIQAEVLEYLCQHAGDIVSRDQLHAEVWQGQIVTENAINKVIAKLRKALGDDPKTRSFIVTHPKKGYRLVAATQQQAPEMVQPTDKAPGLRILLVLILLTSLAWLVWQPNKQPTTYTKATALTRTGGAAYEPAMSPNGRYLAYSVFEDGIYNLYLKDLNSQQQTLLSDGIGNAGGSNWSFDGQQLIYLYTHHDTCELRLLDITDGQVQKQQRVHNCPIGSFGRVAFTHDQQHIIYSEKSQPSAPYYLFSMDLNTAAKKKLKQPPAFLAGNAEFDVHPLVNKLLISSPDEQQWLAFYELDLSTDELTYLFKKNEHLCCAIWSHSGEAIVTMNPHPSNGIIQMNLKGEQVTTLYESTHHLRKPIRVQHNNTYMYSGGTDNYDIQFHHFEQDTTTPAANSSDTDELPRLSADGRRLAFMSRRSGKSQIWVKDLASGSTKPITQFTDHAKYYDFQWSPDDQHIAALLSNGIKIINSQTGTSRLLKLPQKEIRGLSWFDQATLAYSLKLDGQWRVHHYRINSDTAQALDPQWAYIRYHSNPEQTAYIDHDNQLHIKQQLVKLTADSRLIFHRRFGFQVTGDAIYHYQRVPYDWALYKTNTQNQRSKRLFNLGDNGFFATATGVYFSQLNNRTADIYQVLP